MSSIDKNEQIPVGRALSLRVHELLRQRKITAYRLEIESNINHSTMTFILKGENKSASLKTVIMLAKGFKMSLLEFLDSPHFEHTNLLDVD